MKKRVGIIGAGPAGLAAVKELAELGHDVTCFEGSGTKVLSGVNVPTKLPVIDQ